MLARLWWKESRIFGPVWLILGLASAGLQWFLSTMGTPDLRVAAAWAVLYAFASGSAAFAGEREAGNLAFLDALPVPRWTLWAGKMSFALVTTFGLAIAFLGLAWMIDQRQGPAPLDDYRAIDRWYVTLLVEAVAWGLFWSATSRNPLLAGAMAVVSVGVVSLFANAAVPVEASKEWIGHAVHLTAALIALASSAVVMTWQPRFRARRRESGSAGASGSMRVRSSSIGRSLSWQVLREGWPTIVLAGLVGLVLPMFLDARGSNATMTFASLASLLVGLSVFGAEYHSGHRRFLVQHGASPGGVWAWKVGTWGVLMAAFLPAMFGASRFVGSMFGSTWEAACLLFDAFAVGLLCGMAIRRRITAALVALILMIGLVPLQVVLMNLRMVPAWSLVLVPSTLLVVSRAWAGDWLLDRGGVRPGLRLGVLLAVPFGLLGLSYLGYRAYGVPDVGRQFDPASIRAGSSPRDQDAASSYERAADRISAEGPSFRDQNGTAWTDLDNVIERGWDPNQAEVVRWLSRNQGVVQLARLASRAKQADFGPVEISVGPTGQERSFRGLKMLAQLLALDARERLARGDLPATWEDILALLRFSDHLSARRPSMILLLLSAQIHHWAVGLAFEWSGDPHQTPETVGQALGDLKSLAPVPDLAGTLRAESSYFERLLELPAAELGELIQGAAGQQGPSMWERLLLGWAIGPAWERERARRVGRRMVADAMKIVIVEPFQRPPGTDSIDGLDPSFGGSPLTKLLFPGLGAAMHALDRERVNRLALEQAVAIKGWELDHGGDAPEALESLVPGLLGRLPLDPYSGRTFGYHRSEGQPVRPPMLPFSLSTFELRPSKPGRPLISSVGPDRVDDGGKIEYGLHGKYSGDYLFVVP